MGVNLFRRQGRHTNAQATPSTVGGFAVPAGKRNDAAYSFETNPHVHFRTIATAVDANGTPATTTTP